MTRQFKAFLKVLGSIAVVLGAGWFTHVCALHSMKLVERCDLPCQWNPDTGFESCQPLKASLEIKTTPEPARPGKATWYRATLSNQSCRTIAIDPEFFLWNREYPTNIRVGLGGYIAVKDSGGRMATIARSAPKWTMGGGIDGIIPYTNDVSEVEALMPHEKLSNGEGFSRLSLKPGQSVVTSPSSLKPYKWRIVDTRTDHGFGTFQVPEYLQQKNPEKKYAVPPPGFRRLTEYDLPRAGKPVAQFIFADDIESLRFDDPNTPVRNRLRRLVYLLATGWAGDRGKTVRIRASSPALTFEAAR